MTVFVIEAQLTILTVSWSFLLLVTGSLLYDCCDTTQDGSGRRAVGYVTSRRKAAR